MSKCTSKHWLVSSSLAPLPIATDRVCIWQISHADMYGKGERKKERKRRLHRPLQINRHHHQHHHHHIDDDLSHSIRQLIHIHVHLTPFTIPNGITTHTWRLDAFFSFVVHLFFNILLLLLLLLLACSICSDTRSIYKIRIADVASTCYLHSIITKASQTRFLRSFD